MAEEARSLARPEELRHLLPHFGELVEVSMRLGAPPIENRARLFRAIGMRHPAGDC